MPRYTFAEFILTFALAMTAVFFICSWMNSLHPTATILG